MLVEDTLFGVRNKIDISVERIKTFEPMALSINEAGFYVCVSGGKDSSVIQELCIMAGVKCEFVHNHTSVDYPETVWFIREEKTRMEAAGFVFRIEYPRYSDGRQKTMWNGIYRKGLPTRAARWCCAELKEFGGVGRYCITGVRWEESAKRRGRGVHEEIAGSRDDRVILNNDNDMRRRLSESCIPKRKFMLNPIIDWVEEDVWEFIKLRNLPVNPLYAQGFKRVGCIGCPISHNGRRELDNIPKYKNCYYRAVVKHFEYRKERGLKLDGVMESPDSYFEWWLRG
jgi:phosphoadenosine phosphosulfate reductase